jgi:hypothetical protein
MCELLEKERILIRSPTVHDASQPRKRFVDDVLLVFAEDSPATPSPRGSRRGRFASRSTIVANPVLVAVALSDPPPPVPGLPNMPMTSIPNSFPLVGGVAQHLIENSRFPTSYLLTAAL